MHTVPTRDELKQAVVDEARRDPSFRRRLIANPCEAVAEYLDVTVPEELSVHVHEESVEVVHIVLPPVAELTGEDLDAVAGGMTEDPRESGGLTEGSYWGITQ